MQTTNCTEERQPWEVTPDDPYINEVESETETDDEPIDWENPF